MSFIELNLNSKVYQAIQECGYTIPTPVQAKTVPLIMQNKDVIACAQTGTGKTAAFMLPVLSKIAHAKAQAKTTNKPDKPHTLILTPTRELADQITQAANTYGKFLRFNITNLVGGVPYTQQIKSLARGADIIVATPGRLIDHIENNRIDLSQIKVLVLDEADRMLDMGFIDDVEYVTKLTPNNRQTLLFSATVDGQLKKIISKLLREPAYINLSNESVASPQIQQELYRVQNPQHKMQLLKDFLTNANIYKAIVFSATKINTEKLAKHLQELGFSAAALHGDLKQSLRYRTINQLKNGKIQFLIATDVAARGIDINDISHVINYDLPRFCEDYVHRIGRTGRAGKTGIAISFVLPTDFKHLQRIERYLGLRLKIINPSAETQTSANEKNSAAPSNRNESFTKERTSRASQRKRSSATKTNHQETKRKKRHFAKNDQAMRHRKSKKVVSHKV